MNAPLHLLAGSAATGDRSHGRIRFCNTAGSPPISYYLYTPDSCTQGLKVLVSVHGISFNAAEHAMQFAHLCQQQNLILVAPVFAAGDFPGYQRLGLSRRRPRPRADLALETILEEVTRQTGADTSRIYLFGYSGGGQFAHRYAMLHPRRVIGAALGAPGWYTYPDLQTPFPRGLRGDTIPPDSCAQDYLQVPMGVFVGEYDCYRDPALNTSPTIDRQQGYTRVDRGQRWVRDMQSAARAAGLDTSYRFSLLEHCGHSFLDCMVKGRLGHLALEFLLGGGRALTCSRPRIRDWTVFASG